MLDKDRAKQIILEIIRQAGGTLRNKTNLYKAFYYAHLRFAEDNPGYLSSWPIVRMPRGPGIDDAGVLLEELVNEGKITAKIHFYRRGPGLICSLVNRHIETGLSPEAVAAIKYGVDRVNHRGSEHVSHDSHIVSRSWNDAQDGQELNIYADSLSEEEFQKRKNDMRAIWSVLNES